MNNDTPLPKRTTQEFKDFCQNNLLGELKLLEAKRQQAIVDIVVFSLFMVAIIFILVKIVLLSTGGFIEISWLFIFPFLCVLIGCMCWWVAFYEARTETYAGKFKSKIIQKIVSFIDVNKTFSYSYDEDKYATLLAFRHSQLFQESLLAINIIQADCVSTQIGETSVFFAEICTKAEVGYEWLRHLDLELNYKSVRLQSPFVFPIILLILIIYLTKGISYILNRVIRGQRINYWHFREEVLDSIYFRKRLFKGLFFVADFNKKLKGKLVIQPCNLKSKMQTLNKGIGELIKLEDPEFAKLFVVYGDQIEARYILSTSLMEKLVNFRKKAGRRIHISFRDNKIYVAIEYDEDIFEPRLFKTMLKFKPMREYYESLQLMLGIVEEFNLNRRIWN